MKTKSILKMSVLLVLSLMLGICMNCKRGRSTQKSLNELVILVHEPEEDEDGDVTTSYLYFSNGVVYTCIESIDDSGTLWGKSVFGSYSGTSITFTNIGTFDCTVTSSAINLHTNNGYNVVYDIVTDRTIIEKIENAEIM